MALAGTSDAGDSIPVRPGPRCEVTANANEANERMQSLSRVCSTGHAQIEESQSEASMEHEIV